MSVTRLQLAAYLDELLQPGRFRDYCPNGLQVEGAPQVQRIVSGVTASQALIDAAIDWQADTLLVHHGYFWRGEPEPLVGMKGRRVRALMQHNINLFAFHLPLDCHPELGNNAGLGRVLAVDGAGPADPATDTVPLWCGHYREPRPQSAVVGLLEAALGRSVISIGEGDVTRIAWCTGGGQGYIEQAVAAGAELFISGEIAEQTVHVARELGIGFIAAGHHATERFGARSLGQHVAAKFALEHQFIDIDSPA